MTKRLIDSNYKVLTEEERKKEWEEVEQLVLQYQKYREDPELCYLSQEASQELLMRFQNLFKKYISLIKYGQIDFFDVEMKEFIVLFMDDYSLKKALRRKKQSPEFKTKIYERFGFITKTYGTLPEEDIVSDLYMCFLNVARRYKQIGKNFCAYLYNVYRHEVARHIKNYTKNPASISYKNYKYEDCLNGEVDAKLDIAYEDNYYESLTGLPDKTWINGQSCSEAFSHLTNLQRKILIKYYMEDYNDKQISELTGSHINTINHRRREALDKLCKELGVDRKSVKRSRKSGKFAGVPNELKNKNNKLKK